jgi:hypothetical protein
MCHGSNALLWLKITPPWNTTQHIALWHAKHQGHSLQVGQARVQVERSQSMVHYFERAS